jgi:hypothetical protein
LPRQLLAGQSCGSIGPKSSLRAPRTSRTMSGDCEALPATALES